MVIRVATRNFESAKLLVVDLAGLFGGECVSLQPDGEVMLEPRGESNAAIAHTLGTVEQWLQQTELASVQVWVDENTYKLERQPRPLFRGLTFHPRPRGALS